MRLIHNIAVRLSLALFPVITLWAMVFYFVMVDEINDEADDLLESYAEQLMVKKLSGKELPASTIMTDGHYSLSRIAESYADSQPGMTYYDADFYIQETDETEPARFLKTIFRDNEGTCYELIVSTPTFEKDDLTETILWWVLALYLILLLTVIFITLAVLQKGIRPMYHIMDWLDAYTPGKAHGDLSVDTDVIEFKHMEKTAKEAIKRSDNAFEQQKEFIGNASHELQTPLAILNGRIDWMLDSDTLSEENMGELIQMKREIGHISRLNKTLLLLTKIDNGQFPEINDVNLSELAKEQTEMFEEIFGSRNIACKIQETDSPVIIRMNETLATILVTNLIKNAFVHSTDGGKVSISLTHNDMVVENLGDSALDAAHIFDRFYQGSKKDGSTGLGLALAKTIADRYGLGLSYSFADGAHRFRIDFHGVVSAASVKNDNKRL